MLRHIRFALLLLPAFACAWAPRGDLASLTVGDTATAWYTVDVNAESRRVVPAISFTLQNMGTKPISAVDLILSFWPAGADGEKDSQLIAAVRGEALPSGASTGELFVRSTVGYNLAGATSDLFAHSAFKDWVVKVYARRAGQTVPIGEFKIARRLVAVGGARTVR